MRRLFSCLVLLLLSFAGCREPAVPARVPVRPAVATLEGQGSFQVFGYHAWWMRDQWRGYDTAVLDKVMFFELRATAEGRFDETNGWFEVGPGFVEAMHARGVAVVPTVAVLDAATFRGLLADPLHRRTLRDETLRAIRAAGADGVHLNFEVFEAVDPAVREGLTAFVRALRQALVAEHPGAQLTLFMPGFDYGEAYDEAALAREADYLVVQGYDMHWLTAPEAGPVAPLDGWAGANWRAIVDRYLALGVPRHKIVMTVPYFGYEWPTEGPDPGAATRGEGVPITYAPVDEAYLPLIRIAATERVARYGLHRDPVSGAPYYAYRGADGWYQGWFEDGASLRAKYAFIRQERLAGVAVFPLGYDAGLLAPVLREARTP